MYLFYLKFLNFFFLRSLSRLCFSVTNAHISHKYSIPLDSSEQVSSVEVAPPDGKFTARRSEKAGVTPFGPKSVIMITALSLVSEMSVIKLRRAKVTVVGVVTTECSLRAKVQYVLYLRYEMSDSHRGVTEDRLLWHITMCRMVNSY